MGHAQGGVLGAGATSVCVGGEGVGDIKSTGLAFDW